MTTVGVCVHGRCGSSMLMAMLDAGGLPPVPGSAPGSYELPNLFAVAGEGRGIVTARPRAHMERVPSPAHLRNAHGVTTDLPTPWRIEYHERLHADLSVSATPQRASVRPTREGRGESGALVREGKPARPGPRMSVVGYSNWKEKP